MTNHFKLIGLAFLLFAISTGNAQDELLNIPNLSPQTPNAYQFTKHGEVAVNESTGSISPSIPLLNYIAGDINIPITLSYSGNGVKVAQDPTWVGINWNLMPAGVITRQVRDEIDEKATDHKFYSDNQLNNNLTHVLDYEDIHGGTWYDELSEIGNSTNKTDSEVDIFNYNFLGYSGSFYLDEAGAAHIVKYDKELDIDFIYAANNKSTIIITTPNGDKFFFGGTNASESSKSWVNSGAQSRSNMEFAQNAFYLYSIAPYGGGSISFTYENLNPVGTFFKIDTQEHLAKYVGTEGACGNGPSGYDHSERDIFLELESKVYLSKIESTFNDNHIQFNTLNLDARRRRLNNIVLTDINNATIKKVELSYLTDNNDGHSNAADNRYFLEQVDFLDKSLNKIKDYQLEYYLPTALPSKWSYNRDEGGYYNGDHVNNNNNTLLPNHLLFNNTIALADRSVNTTNIKYGSLTKIIYPTGGYSVFDYEVPVVDYTTSIVPYSMFVYHNDPTRNGETDYDDQLWYQQDGTFYFEAGEKITGNLIITTVGDLTNQNNVSVSAQKIGGGTSPYPFVFQIGNPENSTKTYNKDFTITILETGQYTFKLNLNAHSTLIGDNTVEIDVRAGLDIPDYQVQTPTYFPALRIKNVSTYTDGNTTPLVKRYYYNTKENIGSEINSLIRPATYVYNSSRRRGCSSGGIIPFSTDHYINLTASALNNVYGDDSGKILYPYVTISHGGNNFENGGIEKRFRVFPDSSPLPYFPDDEIYFTYGSNLSYANSTLLMETVFEYDEIFDLFTTKKITDYDYRNFGEVHTMHNIKAVTLTTSNIGPNDIRRFNFGLYDISSRRYQIEKVVTTSFPKSGTNSIVNLLEYDYGKYSGLPISIKNTGSKGTTEKKIFYPYQAEVYDQQITAAQKTILFQLDTEHRLDQPYMTWNYNDELRIGAQLTTFSDQWSGSRIWPQTESLAKATNTTLNSFEDVITYNNYNTYGKLTEVSFKNGPSTKFVYNSNQQVILKIENFDLSTMDDGVASGSECFYQDTYPESLVTVYEYDPINGNLISIKNPNCEILTYEYDPFNRLKLVKDEDGNILKDQEYHYKGQSN